MILLSFQINITDYSFPCFLLLYVITGLLDQPQHSLDIDIFRTSLFLLVRCSVAVLPHDGGI